MTNVQYFAGSTPLGSATASPYRVSATLTNAGSYALTAVATAGGLSATSSVVNITVTAPVPISLAGSAFSSGAFSFSYNSVVGANYVVDASSNLVSWVPFSTNTAASNPAKFTDTAAASPFRFYRVSRVTNP